VFRQLWSWRNTERWHVTGAGPAESGARIAELPGQQPVVPARQPRQPAAGRVLQPDRRQHGGSDRRQAAHEPEFPACTCAAALRRHIYGAGNGSSSQPAQADIRTWHMPRTGGRRGRGRHLEAGRGLKRVGHPRPQWTSCFMSGPRGQRGFDPAARAWTGRGWARRAGSPGAGNLKSRHFPVPRRVGSCLVRADEQYRRPSRRLGNYRYQQRAPSRQRQRSRISVGQDPDESGQARELSRTRPSSATQGRLKW
jgi:hypothetical protein